MVVHFYILFPFPIGMAASKRLTCYAKGLISDDNFVDVNICTKCFTINEKDEFPPSGNYQGINYEYVSGKIKSSNKLLRKIQIHVSEPFNAFLHALRTIKKDDVLFCYFYNNRLYELLMLAAKIKGAKIVREVCEHPSALCNMNSLKGKVGRWIEYHILFSFFDGFVTISKDLNDFVNRYKSKSAKTIIVPILVEDSYSCDESSMKSAYNVPYIIHTGTMLEQKDSVSKIIKAFARLKRETHSNCRLVFTGPHANENCQYIPLMEELNVRDSIDLLGLVSIEEVKRLQYYATLTIIYKSDNLQTRNCFPTKLGEMLMSGCPVITTNVGDAKLYLKNRKNALIFNPDDEDALVNDMKSLLNNSSMRKEIGVSGRKVALESFNPIKQGKRLSNFLKQL